MKTAVSPTGALDTSGLVPRELGFFVNTGQLPHLQSFASAAELGSFTAAARALKLTQAAISQRIHALEQDLDVPLFDRKGGHVALTNAGHRLYGYAQRILALHSEARAEVTGRTAPLTGELTLAASSVPGDYVLPALLHAFRQLHPHVHVRALVADSGVVLRQVEKGLSQLGLVGAKSESGHLECICFGVDELVLVVPPSHAWRRRKRVSLSQLAAQPIIVREAGSGQRSCLEHGLKLAGKTLKDLRVGLELGSNQAIKEAVLQGLGLAVLSTRAVRKELGAGQLHSVRVIGLPLARQMFVVWDRRRALPIAARLFLDLLKPAVAPVHRR